MQRKEPQYEDGIEYWECSKCSRWLPNTEYYYDSRTGNGLKAQCKSCHTKGSLETRNPDNARRLNREYMRRARVKDGDKFRARERNRPPASPEKVKTRSELNGAVKNGTLEKPTLCSNCGSPGRINGHHHDYDKPLEVDWLCPLCHAEAHRLGTG